MANKTQEIQWNRAPMNDRSILLKTTLICTSMVKIETHCQQIPDPIQRGCFDLDPGTINAPIISFL